MSDEFAYVWTYLVRRGQEGTFARIYGPDGDWVRLFRRAEGYLGTELYRDRDRPGRFLTVDRWRGEAAFRAFRERFAAEFEDLDGRCEALTEQEAHVGDFQPVAG
jgi:heme-degrading monooxygenase HmoA